MANGAASTTSAMRSVLDFVRRRRELVALAALLLVAVALPGARPSLGIYGFGVAAGAGLALHAIGLVLVHRGNRIVNFAQVQLGVLAGALFSELSTRRTFLVHLRSVCGPCVRGDAALPGGVDVTDLSASQIAALRAEGWIVTANGVLALVVGVAAAVAVTWALYHLVIKRFADAPRLVLTLVTIALGGLLAAVAPALASVVAGSAGGQLEGGASLPLDIEVRLGGTVFETPDVLRVLFAAVAVVVLTVYLRRSTVGIALRGAADNPSRAETLGVPVARVTARVWVIAALCSSVVSVLDAAALGSSQGAASGTLIRALAPAVFAAFVSLPVAVVGAVVVGVFDQAMLYRFDSAQVTEGILLVVIVGVLLLLRVSSGRVDNDLSNWTAAREVRPIPQQLRALPNVQRWLRTGAASLSLALLALPWILSPTQTNQATIALITGMVALSLLVLTGWAGQISLGQVGLAAVGAWTAAVLGWPFPFGLLAGALAGAIVAAAIGVPALRLPGLFLAVSTLAFAIAVPAILLNPQYLAKPLPDSLARPVVLGVDLSDERAFFYLVLSFLALTAVAVVGMRRSRTARALVAARDNEAAAQSFGIDVFRARLAAFAASGFIAAVAGVLASYASFGVEGQLFGPDQSVRAFLVAVIGGLGTVAGPLIGAGLVLVTAVLAPGSESWLLPLIALALLLVAPGGLASAFAVGRDAVLRRMADRLGLVVPTLNPDGGTSAAVAPIEAPRDTYVPRRYRLEGNWVVRAPRQGAAEEVPSRA